MPKIMLNPDFMREKAVQLEQCRDLQEEIIKEVVHLVDNLLDHWKGAAQEAFRTAFEARRGTYAKFAPDLSAFSGFLVRYATAMEAIDNGEPPPIINPAPNPREYDY